MFNGSRMGQAILEFGTELFKGPNQLDTKLNSRLTECWMSLKYISFNSQVTGSFVDYFVLISLLSIIPIVIIIIILINSLISVFIIYVCSHMYHFQNNMCDLYVNNRLALIQHYNVLPKK